jgi:hypothetical protein
MVTLRRRRAPVGVKGKTLFVVTLVEVAELVAAKGGASALGAVHFDVLTAIWEIWHGDLLPPPPRSIGIMGLAGFCDLISWLQ